MPDTTGYKQDRAGAYIEKDPEATLDYTLDWTDWLGSTTILTATYAVTADADDSDPVTSTGSSNTTTTTTVTLTGGTVNEVYTVNCTITTEAGTTERKNFRVLVKTKSV
jgi:hypothetical protein